MLTNNTGFIFILGLVLIGSSFSANGIKTNTLELSKTENSDFYFVHISDTHVMNKQFDKYERYKQNFVRVLDEITHFKEKPAFVALTGDTVEWGGSRTTGALNYQTLLSCIYQKDGKLYADSSFTIPIYTTPGNHDYLWENSLKNYKNYLRNEKNYLIDMGSVTLFFIDSGSNYYLEPWDWLRVLGAGLFDEDIEWLEKQFSNHQSDKKIVFMHHPAVNYRDEKGIMIDVIARNRDNFIQLCENYDVELVLAGHTHSSVVYDGSENIYDSYPFYCSNHTTLFVQTDDCKQDVNYRNVTVSSGDIVVHECIRIDFEPVCKNLTSTLILQRFTNILKDFLKEKFYRYIYLDT